MPTSRKFSTRCSLSQRALESAKSAITARDHYLQSQAAAWVILNDQLGGAEGPSERASRIAVESSAMSNKAYWRSNQITTQRYLIAKRETFGVDMELEVTPIEQIEDQLDEYLRHPSGWHTPLEIILADSADLLERYHFWMHSVVEEMSGSDTTQNQFDLDLNSLGLPSQQLLQSALVGTDRPTSISSEIDNVNSKWASKASALLARIRRGCC